MKRNREKARDERVMRPRPSKRQRAGLCYRQGTGRVLCTLAVCFVLISKGHYCSGFQWILCGVDPESMPLIGSFGLVIYLFDSLDRQVPWYLTYDGGIRSNICIIVWTFIYNKKVCITISNIL